MGLRRDVADLDTMVIKLANMVKELQEREGPCEICGKLAHRDVDADIETVTDLCFLKGCTNQRHRTVLIHRRCRPGTKCDRRTGKPDRRATSTERRKSKRARK